MRSCPRCERNGRRQEIAVMATRWIASGTQTTLRCPRCGWQDVRAEHGVATHPSERPERPRDPA